MNKYAAKNLKNILENHTKWLNNGDGARACLSETDLRGADLCNANLRTAELSGANLSKADLFRADLRRADLYGANLYGADLRNANLRMADLRRADLTKATLTGADLRDADLRNTILPDPEIMNSICPMNCPEKGAFIGWKKADTLLPDECGFWRRVEVIIELQIPARAKRSSATGRKCRCDKAAVLDIQSLDGVSLPKGTIAYSRYMPTFTYEVGQKLCVEDFDGDRWNECSTGIHFFITRQEAVDYR